MKEVMNNPLRPLLGEFNAGVWAREFVRITRINSEVSSAVAADEQCMNAWFANAIMAGYDRAKRECSAKIAELELVQKQLAINHKIEFDERYNGWDNEKTRPKITVGEIISRARCECGWIRSET